MATALNSLVQYRDRLNRKTLPLREREILDYTVQGKTQGEIAQILRLTTRQVRRDSQPLIDKLAAAAKECEGEIRDLVVNGKLRNGKTIQLGHKARWKPDKVVSKVLRRRGLVAAA